MRNEARETNNDTRDVVANATNDLPPEAAVNMPTLLCLKTTVRRVRQRENPQRRQPDSLAELDLPYDVTHFENGENFLIHDSGAAAGKNRLVHIHF